MDYDVRGDVVGLREDVEIGIRWLGFGAGLGKFDRLVHFSLDLRPNGGRTLLGEQTGGDQPLFVGRQRIPLGSFIEFLASIRLGITFEVTPQTHRVDFQQRRSTPARARSTAVLQAS